MRKRTVDNDSVPDPPDLLAESREQWDRKAAFWDEQMGEGNQTQRLLLRPAVERMMELTPGELIARARARGNQDSSHIEYHVADATDEEQIVALADGRRFDAALCAMALHDIADIAPLMRAVARALKPSGRFVVTVPHPAFNFSGASPGMDEHEDADGDLVVTRYVKVVDYLSAPPSKAPAMAGDPSPHYQFNRPLSALLAPAFAAGFVLDALEEPAFSDDAVAGRPLGWSNFRTIPPVLVARLRPRAR